MYASMQQAHSALRPFCQCGSVGERTEGHATYMRHTCNPQSSCTYIQWIYLDTCTNRSSIQLVLPFWRWAHHMGGHIEGTGAGEEMGLRWGTNMDSCAHIRMYCITWGHTRHVCVVCVCVCGVCVRVCGVCVCVCVCMCVCARVWC